AALCLAGRHAGYRCSGQLPAALPQQPLRRLALPGRPPRRQSRHMTPVERGSFIRTHTSVGQAPLVPEIALHLASDALPLWQATEEQLEAYGLPPPFWAFAWAGGQALARWILDKPGTVAGKRVLDFGAGSGLVAIAAARSGAAAVMAVDI